MAGVLHNHVDIRNLTNTLGRAASLVTRRSLLWLQQLLLACADNENIFMLTAEAHLEKSKSNFKETLGTFFTFVIFCFVYFTELQVVFFLM